MDQATSHGLLDNRIEKTQSDKQSTFRATQKLVNLFHDANFEFQYHDVIRLRDTVKAPTKKSKRAKERSRLVGYADTPQTKKMREEVQRINEFLSTIELKWPALLEQDDTLSRERGGTFSLTESAS